MSNAPNPAGYDAILIVGFGGPESPDEVMPFLENVVRGRKVPRERLEEVAQHYLHLGGRSPINEQTRALMAALRPELDRRGVSLPLYWGNRNWHPFLTDTLNEMTRAGVHKALAVVLAAYSSYSSCRQYRENIEAARESAGAGAPPCDKLRVFFNHPGFIAANADRLREALARSGSPSPHVVYTAHSIPGAMTRGCDYVAQLQETARLVSEALGLPRESWSLAYQSRSGRPDDPWLEPDILDHLAALKNRGVTDVVVHPVGFLSDHMEVLYDLDEEARLEADRLGIRFTRAQTVGTHPEFLNMLAELIVERMGYRSDRRAVGLLPASHDVCPVDCCLPSVNPPRLTIDPPET